MSSSSGAAAGDQENKRTRSSARRSDSTVQPEDAGDAGTASRKRKEPGTERNDSPAKLAKGAGGIASHSTTPKQHPLFVEEDLTSLESRAGANLVVSSTIRGWLDSVHYQMSQAMESMQKTEVGQNRYMEIQDVYDKKEAAQRLSDLREWLLDKRNQKSDFVKPHKGKGCAATIPKVQGDKISVANFCKLTYKMSVDEYAASINTPSCPGYDLANFALSRFYRRARVAVLYPASSRASVIHQYDVWDSNTDTRPTIGNPILKVACNGVSYSPLIQTGSVEEERMQQILTSPSSNIADQDALAEESEGEDELPRSESGLRGFRTCKVCSKNRLFPANAVKDECKYNDMHLEKECKHPAIYDEIRDNHKEQKNMKLYTRTIAREPLNLAYLFHIVQAAGGMERLKQLNKISEVAKMLGATPEQASRAQVQNRLLDDYNEVFQTPLWKKFGAHIKLETYLRDKSAVKDSLSREGPDIRRRLGLEEGTSAHVTGPFQQLRPIFEPVAATPERVEDVLDLLKEVVAAAKEWQRYAKDLGRDVIWAPLVDEIVEDATRAFSNAKKTGSLVMLGPSRVGKSFLVDNILRMSECDKSRYRDENEDAIVEPSDLEASKFLEELRAKSSAARMGDSEDDFPLFVADPEKMMQFASTKELELELKAAAEFAKFCTGLEQARAVNFDNIRFVMPSGKTDGSSSTATSISIRRAVRYQLVAQYKARESLLNEWQKYSGSGRTTKKIIVEQVKKALGMGVEESADKAEDFLRELASDPTKLSELRLDAVLGKSFGFAGAGRSAVQDRILVRGLLYNVQGLRDDFTHDIAVDVSQVGQPHPFLNSCGQDRVSFGALTLPVLERITLFGPFSIAPTGESDWVDTAGCGDGDKLKKKVLQEELSRAESIIVVSAQNLRSNDLPCKPLRDSHAFKQLIQAVVSHHAGAQAPEQQVPDRGRVCLLWNREMDSRNNNQLFTAQDLDSVVFQGEVNAEGRSGVRPTNRSVIKELVIDELNDTEETETDERSEAKRVVAEQVAEAIPTVIPAVLLATSLVMHTDPTKFFSELQKTELLRKSKIYHVLGMIECFLRAGTARNIKTVIDNALKWKDQIEDLEGNIRDKMPLYSDEAMQYQTRRHRQTKEREAVMKYFSNSAMSGYTMPSLDVALPPDDIPADAPSLPTMTAESTGSRFVSNPHVALAKLIETALRQIAAKFSPLTEFNKAAVFHTREARRTISRGLDSDNESDSDEETDCRRMAPGDLADEFSARLLQYVRKEILRCLKVQKKHFEHHVHVSVKGLYEDFVQKCVARLCKEEHVTEEQPSVEHLVEKVGELSKRTNLLTHRVFANVIAFVESKNCGEQATQNLCKTLTKTRQAKRIEVLKDDKHSIRTAFAEDCLKEVQEAIDFELTQRTQRRGELLPVEDFICRLGLNKAPKGKKINVNSIKKIAMSLLSRLQPEDMVNMCQEDLAHLEILCEGVEELRLTLERTAEAWEIDANYEEMGRKLIMDFRRLRYMESLAPSMSESGQRYVSPEVRKPFIDPTPRHGPDIPHLKGFVLFDASSDLRKAFDAEWEVHPELYAEQLHRIGGRDILHPSNSKKLQKLVYGKEQDPDWLFKKYASILGMSESHCLSLRVSIAFQAMRAAPESAEHKYLREVYGDEFQYVEKIREKNTVPDLLALCFLVEFYHRPLNLYVPWQDQPLRIEWSESKEVAGAADALILLGWVKDRRSDAKALIFAGCTADKKARHGGPGPSPVARLGSLSSSRSREPSGIVDDSPSFQDSVVASAHPGGSAMDVEHDSEDRDWAGALAGASGSPSWTPLASPTGSRASTPLAEARQSQPPEQLQAFLESDSTFAVSSWSQSRSQPELVWCNARRNLCLNKEDVLPRFGFFTERFVGARATRREKQNPGRHTGWPKTPYPRGALKYDDSFAHGDDFLAVFDGVGGGGMASGQLARSLAARTAFWAATPVHRDAALRENYNRSSDILDSAYKESVGHWQNQPDDRLNRPSSTAVVLSLVRRTTSDELPRICLDHATLGDSQWAHFRRQQDAKYKCIWVSRRMYHEGGDLKNPAPAQASRKPDSLWDPIRLCYNTRKDDIKMEDSDMVLLGSDGFFEGFLWPKWPKFLLEDETREENEERHAEKLMAKLTQIFQEHQVYFDRRTGESNTQQSFTEYVGEKLFEHAKRTDSLNVEESDDISCVLARYNEGRSTYAFGKKLPFYFEKGTPMRAQLEKDIQTPDGFKNFYEMWSK